MKKDYFYCYSINLHKWFAYNGLPFVAKGKHQYTGKTYWIYPSGRIVDMLLDEYRKNK